MGDVACGFSLPQLLPLAGGEERGVTVENQCRREGSKQGQCNNEKGPAIARQPLHSEP